MAELHDALKYLGPVDWADVPHEDRLEDLQQYLTDTFAAGELICNSVPPHAHGTPFHASEPFYRQPNLAKSHQDMHPSSARAFPPHMEHEKLQKNWGKPMKFSKSANPLDVHIYKMAGNDRHGAWFARRSVHEGIGFDKFHKAMMREFPESMTVSGGPGAGAIRGLAADRRVERIDVKGTGELEVYELSAQFPGPVTPRDFSIMLATSDDTLSDKSAAQLESGARHVPRHYMIVSKPIDHPDIAQRASFVRGQYESVELIREIPLHTAKAKSTPNLTAQAPPEAPTNAAKSVEFLGSGEHTQPDDPELNPVEWIMITRSDPGGGIPRFLVERGTPEAMLGDIHKFFNWACQQDFIPSIDDDSDKQQETAELTAEHQMLNSVAPSNLASGTNVDPRSAGHATTDGPSDGVLNHLTKALEAGLDSIAPASVAAMVHNRLDGPGQKEHDFTDNSSDTSSLLSFMSAEETRVAGSTVGGGHPHGSADNLSVLTGDLSDSIKDKKHLSRHEKEVLKLHEKREKLDARLAKKRQEEEHRLQLMHERDASEAAKQREKLEKELQRTEEKHRRELEKLEQRRAKEARKVEEKRRKKDEQGRLSLVVRERDDFRSQVDLWRRENELLRGQVMDLQAQNTVLADRLGKLVGEGALKGIGEEVAKRRRTSSMRSHLSEEV